MTDNGLILDTSVLIAGERRRLTANAVLLSTRSISATTDVAISSVSVVELTHGIYRARDETALSRRQQFVSELIQNVTIHAVSLEIALLAGEIDGKLAGAGLAVGFQDLVIGATALHLGYGVATLNARHFQLIPGLRVVSF